jgi:hypothetical protein
MIRAKNGAHHFPQRVTDASAGSDGWLDIVAEMRKENQLAQEDDSINLTL